MWHADSIRLLETTLEDGFWQRHGLEPEDLPDLQSEFVDSTYHREALPFLKEHMDDQERRQIEQIIKQDLERHDCSTMDELLEQMDEKHPPKLFELIRRTPISGLESLFLDAGPRNSRLLGPDGEDYTAALHALRLEYISDSRPHELSLVRANHWEKNKGVIFPQLGTMHRAIPGNEHHRELHLGFLSLLGDD